MLYLAVAIETRIWRRGYRKPQAVSGKTKTRYYMQNVAGD